MYTVLLLLLAILCLLSGVQGQVRPYNPFASQEGNVIFQEKIRPTYILTAPRVIRPDSIYRLGVSLLPESPDLMIKAIIRRERSQISSGSVLVDSGSSNNVIMKIPPSITQGEYRLKVEGFDLLHPQSAVFSQEKDLFFNPEFLSIVIESNRVIYTNSMEGVVSLMYQLPPYPTKGRWTIRVEAMAQTYEQKFYVDRYYLTFFELLPTGPAYALDTDETYQTAMSTAFHAEKIAKGNATVRVYVKAFNSSEPFRFVRDDHYPWVSDFEYEVDLKEVGRTTNQLAGSVVRVEFAIRDFFMGEERIGFIETRIIRANLKLHFAGTQTAIFKPGMPFSGHIYVMYEDNEPLTTDKLATARLVLKPVVTMTNGQIRSLPDIIVPKQGDYLTNSGPTDNEMASWMERQAEDAEYQPFRTSGIYHFRFQVPKDTASMRIKASYQDENGDEASAEMQAISYYSPQEMFVHVYSSTNHGRIGESAILHVKSNFAFERYQYVVSWIP